MRGAEHSGPTGRSTAILHRSPQRRLRLWRPHRKAQEEMHLAVRAVAFFLDLAKSALDKVLGPGAHAREEESATLRKGKKER